MKLTCKKTSKNTFIHFFPVSKTCNWWKKPSYAGTNAHHEALEFICLLLQLIMEFLAKDISLSSRHPVETQLTMVDFPRSRRLSSHPGSNRLQVVIFASRVPGFRCTVHIISFISLTVSSPVASCEGCLIKSGTLGMMNMMQSRSIVRVSSCHRLSKFVTTLHFRLKTSIKRFAVCKPSLYCSLYWLRYTENITLY